MKKKFLLLFLILALALTAKVRAAVKRSRVMKVSVCLFVGFIGCGETVAGGYSK